MPGSNIPHKAMWYNCSSKQRKSLLELHQSHAFADLVKVSPIKHFNLIIAQNSGNLYLLHEKSCLWRIFPTRRCTSHSVSNRETSPGTASKSMPRQYFLHTTRTQCCNWYIWNLRNLVYFSWFIKFWFGIYEKYGVYLVYFCRRI